MRCGDFDENGRYELKDFPGVYLDSSIYENVQMMTTEPYVTRDGEELVCRLYRTYDTYAIGYELRDTFRFTDTEVYWDLDYVYATDDVKERRDRILFYIRCNEMESVESALSASCSRDVHWITIDVEDAKGSDGYFTTVDIIYKPPYSYMGGKYYVRYFDSYVDSKRFAWDICGELKKVRRSAVYMDVTLTHLEHKDHVSYFADNPYFEERDYYDKF